MEVDEGDWLDFKFQIVNSGQSPARNVHINTEAYYRLPEGKNQSMGSSLINVGDIAAGESTQWTFDLDGRAQHRPLQRNVAGGGYFEIKVSAEYDTVFPALSGDEQFNFEVLLSTGWKEMRVQARPKHLILHVGRRKRERKEQG